MKRIAKGFVAALLLTAFVRLSAVDLVSLKFAWDYAGIIPDSFNLYESPTADGDYSIVVTVPGICSNEVSPGVFALHLTTNLDLMVEPGTNHFWFLTAKTLLGESLPSNTVTGASPGTVRLFRATRNNKTN